MQDRHPSAWTWSIYLSDLRWLTNVLMVTPAFYVPLPTGPKAARIPGCARHPSAHPIGSPVLTNVVITTKGADDDVADSSTGTNKGNPTVTAIFASPADSESGDSARNSHPCGCRHSC